MRGFREQWSPWKWQKCHWAMTLSSIYKSIQALFFTTTLLTTDVFNVFVTTLPKYLNSFADTYYPSLYSYTMMALWFNNSSVPSLSFTIQAYKCMDIDVNRVQYNYINQASRDWTPKCEMFLNLQHYSFSLQWWISTANSQLVDDSENHQLDKNHGSSQPHRTVHW